MNDWFEWNGVKCTDYGIHVSEHPPITIPNERATFTAVPGRAGTLTTLEGDDVYDDMILSATCFIDDPEQIPTIAAWLRGSGTVTFANREGGFYYARIANQISFDKILRGNPHRSFVVNFRCQPFFYLDETSTVSLIASGKFVTNPYSVISEPVVTVYATGDVTLMVGTTAIALSELEGSITLDTPLKEAYAGVASLNNKMSGDFPVLRPGANAVSWTGAVSKVVIQPNWRSL